MSKQLVIIGAGEFALIAYEYFAHDSDYVPVAFCVNQSYITETSINGLPIHALEEIELSFPADKFDLFVAIPASRLNRTRTQIYRDLKSRGYNFATYISSRAFVWRNAVVGENTFIFEMNVIQPFVSIGNNCILWSGNHVGHRTTIEDNVFVASHAVISGYCTIGSGSFVGVNSTLNDNVSIGASCIIGSGSLIVKNTDPEGIYVGSPARRVPNKSSFDVEL